MNANVITFYWIISLISIIFPALQKAFVFFFKNKLLALRQRFVCCIMYNISWFVWFIFYRFNKLLQSCMVFESISVFRSLYFLILLLVLRISVGSDRALELDNNNKTKSSSRIHTLACFFSNNLSQPKWLPVQHQYYAFGISLELIVLLAWILSCDRVILINFRNRTCVSYK